MHSQPRFFIDNYGQLKEIGAVSGSHSMSMAILHMVSLRDVLHATSRASAGLVAAAAFAVHGANVGGSVLLADTMGFCFAGGGIAVAVFMVATTSSKAECSDCQDGKKEFFHV